MRECEIVKVTTTGWRKFVLRRFTYGIFNYVIAEDAIGGAVSVYPEEFLTLASDKVNLPDSDRGFKYNINNSLLRHRYLHAFAAMRPISRAHDSKGVPFYACLNTEGKLIAIAEEWLRQN